MTDDARLLSGMICCAAHMVQIGAEQLPGTSASGVAPPQLWDRFAAQATEILRLVEARKRCSACGEPGEVGRAGVAWCRDCSPDEEKANA